MRDECDYCFRPGILTTDVCKSCEVTKRQKHLTQQIHQAEQIVWWLSYQSEMSGAERAKLKQMSYFLQDLRKQIQ